MSGCMVILCSQLSLDNTLPLSHPGRLFEASDEIHRYPNPGVQYSVVSVEKDRVYRVNDRFK